MTSNVIKVNGTFWFHSPKARGQYSRVCRLCRNWVCRFLNVFEMLDIEDPPWVAYRVVDGHQRDGFMLFCTRLAECKTS